MKPPHGRRFDRSRVARVRGNAQATAIPVSSSWRAFLLLLITGVTLVGGGLTGCAFNEGLLIGTTNFTESRILANMYALVLEHVGLDASLKELTTREIVEPALEKNQLQIIPDYLGTFTEYLNTKENGPDAPPRASSDVASTYVAAQQLAAARGLTVLPPAPAQDQNAYAVTPEFAQAHQLKTLSQLAIYSQAAPIVLGAGPECLTRPTCQPGLEQVYGIKFADFVSLDAGGPLTIEALLQQKIQLGLVFSSQGAISTYDLVILEDDKHLQKADNVIPVVNSKALTPAIAAALNSVSESLTTPDLQQLNAAVDVQRQDPRQVAREWLTAKGLI